MMKNPFFIDNKILIKQSCLNENGSDFDEVKLLTATDLFFFISSFRKESDG
jgi:hypothetical protein